MRGARILALPKGIGRRKGDACHLRYWADWVASGFILVISKHSGEFGTLRLWRRGGDAIALIMPLLGPKGLFTTYLG